MASPKKTTVAAPVAAAEQGRYLVGAMPILRDGDLFEPGSVIELTPAQATRLGLVAAPDASEQPAE